MRDGGIIPRFWRKFSQRMERECKNIGNFCEIHKAYLYYNQMKREAQKIKDQGEHSSENSKDSDMATIDEAVNIYDSQMNLDAYKNNERVAIKHLKDDNDHGNEELLLGSLDNEIATRSNDTDRNDGHSNSEHSVGEELKYFIHSLIWSSNFKIVFCIPFNYNKNN